MTRGYFLSFWVLVGFFSFCFSATQAQNHRQKQGFSPDAIQKGMQAAHYESGVLMVRWRNQQFYTQQARFLQQHFQISAIDPLFIASQINFAEQTTFEQAGLTHVTKVVITPEKIATFIAYAQKHNLTHYIEPVPQMEVATSRYVSNDRELPLQWGLEKAQVYEAWAISKGSSDVIIGIVDSGILPTHEDLRQKLFYNEAERRGVPNFDDDQNGYVDDSLGYDFGNRDANVQDAFWHGTCVAGVAAAHTDNNLGVAGVGFQARLLPIKVIRDITLQTTTANASIYEGIVYAANRGCQIINVSLINSGDEGVYFQHQQDAINYAALVKKALVVIAAGNNNRANAPAEKVYYPAAYQNALSVAATDRFDERSETAIVNPFIDLSAPGVEIRTTHVTANNSYEMQRGSSFAAPFVAGAAALLKAHYPKLTGLQIGELLRVNTDNIYQIAANQPFVEKLGTGRINVAKAFANYNTSVAVRLQNLDYTNGWGKQVYNGDTLKLVGTFVNWLNKVSNLKITLQSVTPFATVLQNNLQVAQLNSLDSVQNKQNPFVVYVQPNTPPNTQLLFRLGFSNGSNYTDYQYFTITTEDDTYNLTFNDVKLSVAANGRMGNTDAANRKGLGVLANTTPLAKEIGLLVNFQNKIPNCVLTTPNNKANHFKAGSQARKIGEGLQSLVVGADFTDDLAGTHRIGLQINQQITARINTPHHQYVLVEYALQNNSNQDIDSLAVGLFADWDIDNSQQNRADWHAAGQFAYSFAGNQFTGIKVFGGNSLTCFSIDKLNPSQNLNNLALQDSFSVAEKIMTLRSGLQDLRAGNGNNIGTDVAQVVGTTIGNFKRGETRKVVFALLIGTSLNNLVQTAQVASQALNPLTPKGKQPTTHPVLCANDLTIKPKTGTLFRFYKTNNLGVPFHVGNSLAVTTADTAQTFYISQVDSTLESELQTYRFKIQQPKALFFAVDSLNLVDSSAVWFFNGTTNLLRSDWNFGDQNFSTLRNPVHRYTRTGTYTVTLTITDSLGCFSTASKTIKVVRLSKSPLPIVTDVKVCAKEAVLIKPQNGTRFRFYADETRKKLLATGNEFLLRDVNVSALFVTNVDSLVESPPVRLFVTRTLLDPTFSPSVRADTILYERIYFADRSRSDNAIVKWEWDFGDGSPRVNSPNPSYLYNRQGIFKVSLKVTDNTGCSASVVRTFKVGKKSPQPILPPEYVACKGQSITIQPSGGKKFLFYHLPTLDSAVAVGSQYTFIPQYNQAVYVVCNDSLVESEPTPVYVRRSELDFTPQIPQEIKQYESPTFRVAVQHPDLVKWAWDFGDGNSSNEESPLYRYQKQGNYTLQVKLTDRWGCEHSLSQVVKVLNRANSPAVQPLTACYEGEAVVSPQGGSQFNFYAEYPTPQSRPLARGKTFTIRQVLRPLTLYVTCADSLVESVPTQVVISLSQLNAEFTTNLDTLNRYEQDTLQLKAKQIDLAASYQWLLNGQVVSTQPTARLVLPKDGQYEVALQVRNAANCEVNSSKKIQVIYDSNVSPFTKLNLFPNPTKGDVAVDLELRKANAVQIHIYNSVGQLVEQTDSQYNKDFSYKFLLQNQASGLYLLRFTIGNRQVVRKVVVE